MQVTAAVARDPDHDFTIEVLALDEPRDDEILVRVSAVGICHTDLVVKRDSSDQAPVVLGHEGAGTVVKVGEAVTKVKVGDKVALSFRSCGHCRQCATGHPAYCDDMIALNFSGLRTDGSKSLRDVRGAIAGNFFGQSSFASFCLAYERNTVVVPGDMPMELLAPLGCGVQTGAGAVMRELACKVGTSILVTGGGAVGLSAVMGAVIQGCKIIVVLEVQSERRLLAQKLGATHVIDPGAELNIAQAVRRVCPAGVDYALDTTGLANVQSAAIDALARRGTLGLVAISPPETPMPGSLMTFMAAGQRIQGIVEGDSDPQTFIPELISLYRAGRFPIDKLVRTYPLTDINRAIRDQRNGSCTKAVLLTD